MSVPKQRHSQGRTNRKRVQYAQKPQTIGSCADCGSPATPHRACSTCGKYKGREVVDVTKKTVKKTKKA